MKVTVKCVKKILSEDGPTCYGSAPSKPLLKPDSFECTDTSCVSGYECVMGAFFPSCCPKNTQG